MRSNRALNILAFAWLLAAGTGGTQPALAQAEKVPSSSHSYVPGSPTYYRGMHGESPQGVSLFRKDPNLWVYTREVAERVGMPLEWASDELKGVAAAAYRMERMGAEEDCGWGGNAQACRPVMQCVLELYFDRQAHPLPWAPNRQVADFDWQTISSAYHFLPANGWAPAPNGDTSRGSKKSPHYPELAARSPFSDPQTGEELGWGARVIAYDREIHSRYAFVRLELGCQGVIGSNPNTARSLYLETSKARDLRSRKALPDSSRPFHEVFLPASWDARVAVLRKQNLERDNNFYQNIWNQVNQGERK